MERQGQIVLQSFPRHLDQMVCRLAWRRFEIGPGVPMNVDDLAPDVDDDRRRRETRYQELLDQIGNRRGADGDRGRLVVYAGLGYPFHQTTRKPFQVGKRAGLSRPPEELPFPVNDGEETFEPADRFGRT